MRLGEDLASLGSLKLGERKVKGGAWRVVQPQGFCACQTTMPPMFEPRTQDGEEGGVQFAQTPRGKLPQGSARLMPGTQSSRAILHWIHWAYAPIPGSLSKELQTHTLSHRKEQRQQPAWAGERELCCRGKCTDRDSKGGGIPNTASSSRFVYTTRFSCLDDATDLPLPVENYGEGLNTF